MGRHKLASIHFPLHLIVPQLKFLIWLKPGGHPSPSNLLPNELTLQRSLTLFPRACQMHPLYIISVSVSSQMEWGVLDITAVPSQAVTLMRDAWMSRGIPESAVKKPNLRVPSADAALQCGYERECEQGVSVTSWQQYKCSLNPSLLFVMTTDSARCSLLL